MRNKKDDEDRVQYEIQKYRQRDLPLSTHIEYLDYKGEEEVHLRDYLSVILKRRSIVLIFLVSVVVTTLILTFMMIPLYKYLHNSATQSSKGIPLPLAPSA